MDLNKAWNKIQEEKFTSSTINKSEIMKAIQQESSSTMAELKKRLKYKINWVIFFLIFAVAAFFFSLNVPATLPLWGTIIAYYLIGLIGMNRQYDSMNTQINPDLPTLDTMKNQAFRLKKVLQVEKVSSLFGMPIVLVCGGLLPGLYTGKSWGMVLANQQILIVIIVGLVVLVPLMWLLGNRLNKIAYGKHLNELEQNIRLLEQLEL